MELSQAKITALVALGIGSMLAGLLPACFTKQSRKQWPLLLSCLLCFGGGVLLSTSIVHILPEAKEEVRQSYKPYIELFFCTGFFLLYLMDEIVHFFYGEVTGHSHQSTSQNGHSHHHNNTERRLDFIERHIGTGFVRRHSSNFPQTRYGATNHQGESSTLLDRPYNPIFYRAKSDSALFCEESPSQLCHVMHQEPCQATTPITNLGLLVALSIHSLLEGLAVGLEGLTSKVLLLLGAIASHKLVVGFCLGVELASNQYITFCKHFICILMFSGASVGGIFFGILISDIPNDVMDVVIPILQALAGGTLLYVTVSEVLPRERARWHQQHSKRLAGVAQLVSVLLGFVTMSAVGKYLVPRMALMQRFSSNTVWLSVKSETSNDDLNEEINYNLPGCACKHCNRHPKAYSLIILTVCLLIFTALIVSIFVFQAEIPNEKNKTNNYLLHDRYIPLDVNHENTSLLKFSEIDQYSYN